MPAAGEIIPAISNKLLLASAGLRYQSPPFPLTSQVLDDLSTSAASVPDFHIVSAELDLGLHRMADAETHFEAACQFVPTNRLFQLNLAVIRLGSTNTAAADDARAKLKQFSSDTTLALPALRSLIADRLLQRDAAGALVYSTQLLANAQATLNDRLQNLGIQGRLRVGQQLHQITSAPAASRSKQFTINDQEGSVLSEEIPFDLARPSSAAAVLVDQDGYGEVDWNKPFCISTIGSTTSIGFRIRRRCSSKSILRGNDVEMQH